MRHVPPLERDEGCWRMAEGGGGWRRGGQLTSLVRYVLNCSVALWKLVSASDGEIGIDERLWRGIDVPLER